MKPRLRTIIPIVAVLVILAVLPLTSLSGYQRSLANLFMVFIILSLSFDILRGNTGYVNLAHAATFGWAAYIFGILINNGLDVIVSALASAVIAFVLIVGVSIPFFRLRGAYFTIITLGFALLSYSLSYSLDWLTQGYQGLSIDVGQRYVESYYVLLGTMIATILTAYAISRSDFGLSLRSMREDEAAAEAFGINTWRMKIKAMAVSSVFPAVAGPMYAAYNNFVSPDAVFGLHVVFAPATMALFGGSGTIAGPILGAVIINALFEFTFVVATQVKLIFLGVILIIVGLFMPDGLVRLPAMRRAYLSLARLLRREAPLMHT